MTEMGKTLLDAESVRTLEETFARCVPSRTPCPICGGTYRWVASEESEICGRCGRERVTARLAYEIATSQAPGRVR